MCIINRGQDKLRQQFIVLLSKHPRDIASLERTVYTDKTAKEMEIQDSDGDAPNCIHKPHRYRIPQISKLFHALMPYSCASHILRGVNCESPISLMAFTMILVVHVSRIMDDASTCDYVV